MAKADEEDIRALYDDVLDCIDYPGWVETDNLKNALRLALEAEYAVGREDGYTDGFEAGYAKGEADFLDPPDIFFRT